MNDKEIQNKLKQLEKKKLVDKEGKSCEYDRYVFNKHKNEITLFFKYGFHKEDVSFDINAVDLDIVIETYKEKPKKEPDVNLKLIKSNQMAEATENNLKGLRVHLFNAIRQLEGGTMNNEQAKAMAQVAQVIINSAKLEMEFKQLTDDKRPVSLLD